ncbi:uncharacterized protein MCYG_05401 [Microsporum canis CBS 113480]|uniref:Uncharacterized protein n=1 Tax=Arthroderma otae (strain ATCC MYA-4605 / CBS 113480) TaxID=554155 RepID=C5FRS9_ARTOC|nr:uncharacterized protein MCYG_05401 [Microsporum canis CBS 113480]EEQ32582.1 predicted protein [Microsporum canis CBS 113480]
MKEAVRSYYKNRSRRETETEIASAKAHSRSLNPLTYEVLVAVAGGNKKRYKGRGGCKSNKKTRKNALGTVFTETQHAAETCRPREKTLDTIEVKGSRKKEKRREEREAQGRMEECKMNGG